MKIKPKWIWISIALQPIAIYLLLANFIFFYKGELIYPWILAYIYVMWFLCATYLLWILEALLIFFIIFYVEKILSTSENKVPFLVYNTLIFLLLLMLIIFSFIGMFGYCGE